MPQMSFICNFLNKDYVKVIIMNEMYLLSQKCSNETMKNIWSQIAIFFPSSIWNQLETSTLDAF